MLETKESTESGFVDLLQQYVRETLHADLSLQSLRDGDALPAFLDRTYSFYEGKLAGQHCVFMLALDMPATPGDMAKHISLVRSRLGDITVFAVPSMSAHNRSRMIGQGISFIVPGNQLYIPELAMDLREYFRASKSAPSKELSPAAQAVLFHHILRINESATMPSVLATDLHYSPMSVGRAFDDLKALGLAVIERSGKERHIRFATDRRTLFEEAQPLLRSPVRSLKHVRLIGKMPSLKYAGETALAQLTALSAPKVDTYAIAANRWKGLLSASSLEETAEYEANLRIETWSYDPEGLSQGPVVDPLSLYVQFYNHRDERVAAAAESLLEEIQW